MTGRTARIRAAARARALAATAPDARTWHEHVVVNGRSVHVVKDGVGITRLNLE